MKKIVLTGVVFLLAVSGCVRLDSFLFGPEKLDRYLRDDYNGAVELTNAGRLYPDSIIDSISNVSFTSGSDNLYGFYLQHTNQTVPVILYCHGKSAHLDYYWPRIKLLYASGCNVFAFDYSGYGMSSGSVSERKLLNNAEDAAALLTDQLGVAVTNILVYGYSLGSVPAVHLAGRSCFADAAGLVLEAPIGSSDLFVQEAAVLPLAHDYFIDLEVDNIAKITQVLLPLLWMHGQNDGRIHWETHGLTLYKNHPGTEGQSKYKKLLTKGAHRDLPIQWGFAGYQSAVSNFAAGKAPF
ncbi:MAG TPA: alpha/beta fold hydrolase [Spirochaetota bacterium]|nr:alpha/beta fold hydrolase [Spirochaetota bacterium]